MHTRIAGKSCMVSGCNTIVMVQQLEGIQREFLQGFPDFAWHQADESWQQRAANVFFVLSLRYADMQFYSHSWLLRCVNYNISRSYYIRSPVKWRLPVNTRLPVNLRRKKRLPQLGKCRGVWKEAEADAASLAKRVRRERGCCNSTHSFVQTHHWCETCSLSPHGWLFRCVNCIVGHEVWEAQRVP